MSQRFNMGVIVAALSGGVFGIVTSIEGFIGRSVGAQEHSHRHVPPHFCWLRFRSPEKSGRREKAGRRYLRFGEAIERCGER